MESDSDIIRQLKKEPAQELRRLQRMNYEWKVEHSMDVIREYGKQRSGYAIGTQSLARKKTIPNG